MATKSKFAGLNAAIGGQAFLDVRVLLMALPTVLLSSLLISNRDENLANYLGWTLANLAAFAACALAVFVLNRGPFRAKAVNPIRWYWVVLTGAFLGALKSLVTAYCGFALGLEPDIQSLIIGRVLQTSLLGAWAIPVFALLGGARLRFQRERDLLVAERVKAALNTAQPNATESEFERAQLLEFVKMAKESLRLSGSPSTAKIIRNIVEKSLRPLSHQLWERESSKQVNFTFTALSRIALLNHPFTILPVAIVFFLSGLPLLSSLVGFNLGIKLSVLSTAVLCTIFLLAKTWQPQRLPAAIAYFLTVQIITTIAVIQIPALIVGPTSLTSQFSWHLVILIWITQLTFLSAFIAGAIANHNLTRNQLEVILGANGVDAAVERSRQKLADREFANFLHGSVQNRLLAVALRLESSPDEQSSVIAELEQVEKVLIDGPSGSSSSNQVAINARLAEVASRWAGFVNIKFTVDADERALADWANILVLIINEAVSNSVRHGLAQNISVKISLEAGVVALEIVDDGIGPRNGAKSLGSQFFDSVSGGVWALNQRAEGGSELRIKITTNV